MIPEEAPARRRFQRAQRLRQLLAAFAAGPRLARSGLFDRAYYLEKNPDLVGIRLPPLLHYLRCGWREGRDPHPLFDAKWYLGQYPDVAAAGANPLVHFLARAGVEQRSPHPLFDSAWYLQQCPELAGGRVNPLVHYLTVGAAEGRDPHPLFDTDWYVQEYPDVAASGLNPLVHYLTLGAHERRSPHPLFDAGWYLENNPDVAVSGLNPLLHFLSSGAAEGRDPHPLFDTDWYLLKNAGVAVSGANPLIDYLRRGAGERRDPNAFFDSQWYLENNPDARAAGVNPLLHFVVRGYRELRAPSSRFSCREYLEVNPDVEPLGICPLVHYMTRGVAEGRVRGKPSHQKPSVVMIDARYPRPDRDAGSVLAMNFVRIFLNLGYGVTFLSTSEFAERSCRKQDLEDAGVTVVDVDDYPSIEDFIRFEGSAADLFFLSRVECGGRHLDQVRACAPRSRIIFNTVDLHSVREMREAVVNRERRSVHRAMRTWERELHVARLADATLVVSAHELEVLLDQAPGTNVFEMPLIWDIPGRAAGFGERRGIGFVGGFLHAPNIDAVRFFLADIWPAIREMRPDMEFHLIGADMPPEIARLTDPGLVVVGHVADLPAALGRLRLTVAPLRYGAGAKGKVVSSLSNGVPCVVTPVASEGMGLVDGETVLVGDSPREFAETVLRLYEDEDLWYRLSDGGLDLLRSRHSLEAGTRHLAAVLGAIGAPAGERAGEPHVPAQTGPAE